jgi:8-oxo-dGTP pyrophosphatase MutT (NUDIX family)
MKRIQPSTMLFLQSFYSSFAFHIQKSTLITPSRKCVLRNRSLRAPARKSAIRLSNSSSKSSSYNVPRAAVSVVVRHSMEETGIPTYVLVQRGKEPNKGIWSLPGGKIELGEKSLPAAKRELWEETGLSVDHSDNWDMKWCEDWPICTTDSIHFDVSDSDGGGAVQFHYVISQWFVEIKSSRDIIEGGDSQDFRPALFPADDAADAKWFTLEDIEEGEAKGHITPGVEKVVTRSHMLSKKGLL